jgi:Homeodomain-like domain
VTAKQIAVKRYVVTLSDEERGRLTTLIGAGKHPARQLAKARILLKADASEAGEGWSDSQIAAALDTSINTVARTRQQLVEEGFEDVLTRKHSPESMTFCKTACPFHKTGPDARIDPRPA